MAHQKMLPVFNRDVLAGDASMLGLMVGLFGLGAASAGIILAGLGPLRQGRLLLAASVAIAGGVVIFAFTRNTLLALALALLLGLIDGVYLTLSNVIFQTRAPDAMRGRVLGAWGMVWGLLPFTALLSGFLAERIGVVAVIAGSGALCLLFAAGLMVASPQLRELT
jgi:MFS family permease